MRTINDYLDFLSQRTGFKNLNKELDSVISNNHEYYAKVTFDSGISYYVKQNIDESFKLVNDKDDASLLSKDDCINLSNFLNDKRDDCDIIIELEEQWYYG